MSPTPQRRTHQQHQTTSMRPCDKKPAKIRLCTENPRHNAATWLMQRGVPIWEAAGFLGRSPEVLQDTYGHHHPDHLHGAAVAIGQKGRYVSVAETVADLTEDRNEEKKPNDILVGVAGFEPATPAS